MNDLFFYSRLPGDKFSAELSLKLQKLLPEKNFTRVCVDKEKFDKNIDGYYIPDRVIDMFAKCLARQRIELLAIFNIQYVPTLIVGGQKLIGRDAFDWLDEQSKN